MHPACFIVLTAALHVSPKGVTARMPAYDYRCTACDIVFEVTRPMSVKGDEHCPTCDVIAARVFSPVPVAFKGTGFHNTDYRPRPKDPAEKPAEKPSEKPAPTCATSG